MAANPPYEGAVFVPGTAESVGVELLKHAKDPQDVVAYAGYGYWAPADVVGKTKGADEQKLTNAPIAPRTSPHVNDDDYESIEVSEDGQSQPGHIDATEPEANAPFPDQGVEKPEANTEAAEEAGVKPKPAAKKPAEPKPAKNTEATAKDGDRDPAPAADDK